MQFSQSVIFFLAILLLTLSTTCNPGVPFRRLPFNGSMYGKRASSALPMDYDNNKAFSSLCELAAEVCSTWYPQQVENN
ncbi:hypothetical protein C0J52_23273 [Blattella germanica]|nr:hypothetical protein C0J52_23273 [Blattella germanica]